MKKLYLYYALILFLSFEVSAVPVLYSEKFRVNTATESNIIQIPVYINDVTDLYAIKLDITYDTPSLMSFNSIVPGPFLKEGDINLIDGSQLQLTAASTGKISNILLSRKSIDSGVTGSGLLFTLKMNKLALGLSDITLSGIEMSNSQAAQISNFDIYYLIPWDDTNDKTKYINDDVNFFATFENKNGGSVSGTCKIEIGGTTYNMVYDAATKIHKYAKKFTSAGVMDWKVICNTNYVASDTVTITAKSCVPQTEICDNIDNDCDGQIDESLTQQCGSTDIGECSFGIKTCSNGLWGLCTGAILPIAEICDGKDNDCDGQTDETLVAPNCDLTNGICLNSKKVCGGSQGWLTCTATQYGVNYELEETKCDNLNNDCDSQTDEGCSCTEGEIKQCGTTDIGECSFGTQICTNGLFGTCTNAVPPAPEVCDALDNDCDGYIDEDLSAPSCSLTAGVCFGSKQICGGNQGWLACTTTQYGTNYEVMETKCDSLNNDCDNQTDEGCSCTDGRIQQCGSTDIGECSFGTQICTNGLWSQCVDEIGPLEEICDGKDNDCDGTADEEVCSRGGGSGGSGHSRGGTGGGGGPPVCAEIWQCGEWKECVGNEKRRECIDIKNCGTEKKKPETLTHCDDTCADGILNNDEEDIDCGGSCIQSCEILVPIDSLVPVSDNNKIEILITEESAKNSKMIVKYDNKGDKRKTGIEFNIDISDDAGKLITSEYFGPLTIEEDAYFVQNYNVPLYLLNKAKEYELSMTVTEKGKISANVQSNFVLNTIPREAFFNRVNFIFFGIVVFILIVIVLFSYLFSKGDKK